MLFLANPASRGHKWLKVSLRFSAGRLFSLFVAVGGYRYLRAGKEGTTFGIGDAASELPETSRNFSYGLWTI